MKTDLTHAGGFVVRKKTDGSYDVLLIKISDGQEKYLLPNGAIEEGESEVEAAKRELMEETGLVNFYLIADLGRVARSGVDDLGKRYQKAIRYFLFLSDDRTKSNWFREAESGKTFLCRWVPLAESSEGIQFSQERGLVSIAEGFIENIK